METLNTPDEIALWISASSAYTGTRTYPNADSAAQFADSMVLELRKRSPQAWLSGEPDSNAEQTHMPREEIMSIAQQASHLKGKVRVIMDDGNTHIASIVDIDHDVGTSMPVHFACDGLTWEYLACDRDSTDPSAESGELPMVSRLELV
jgi:hypothetical protein